MTSKSVRVIFDTNVWISFLIGKRLSSIKEYISDGSIKIIITEQLIAELKIVTRREKLKKYFPRKGVDELIQLFDAIAIRVEIIPKYSICRDLKDNFLFDLIYYSQAEFLVTGDKDLLVHDPFETARILTPADFEKILTK